MPYFQISIEFPKGTQEYDVLSFNSRDNASNELTLRTKPFFDQCKNLGLSDLNSHALSKFEDILLLEH